MQFLIGIIFFTVRGCSKRNMFHKLPEKFQHILYYISHLQFFHIIMVKVISDCVKL